MQHKKTTPIHKWEGEARCLGCMNDDLKCLAEPNDERCSCCVAKNRQCRYSCLVIANGPRGMIQFKSFLQSAVAANGPLAPPLFRSYSFRLHGQLPETMNEIVSMHGAAGERIGAFGRLPGSVGTQSARLAPRGNGLAEGGSETDSGVAGA